MNPALDRRMLNRDTSHICQMLMPNGLTLELTYNDGSTYGVWLLGEHLVWWVIAASA
jgi:hypothetical protein